MWDALHGKSSAVYNGSGTPEFVLAASSGKIRDFDIAEEDRDLYEGITDEDWTSHPVMRND